MAENFTAVDPSGSENRVPDIWERLVDGDGAAISLLIEEIKERKALMKTLFEGTQRMKTIITRDLNLAKLELEICQGKMMSVENKVANFFKALEQTENAEKLITTKFLKKFKLKDLVEEEEEEGAAPDGNAAVADQDGGEAASSSSSSVPVAVLANSIALNRQPRMATCS